MCAPDIYPQDIVPPLLTSQRNDVLNMLTTVVAEVKKEPLSHIVTPRQQFCWGIVATFCGKIQPQQKSLTWIQTFEAFIAKLCEILSHFSAASQRATLEKSACRDIQQYIEWTDSIQNVLSKWNVKIMEQKVNFDEIMQYADTQDSLVNISKALHCTDYEIVASDIQGLKDSFRSNFELLNCLLLRYIPKEPRAGW